MKSQIAFAAVLLASASLVACQILLGIDDTSVDAGAENVGPSSSSSSGASVDAACEPYEPVYPVDPTVTALPPPPMDGGASDAGIDAGDISVEFAVREISLFNSDEAFGYDLDGYNLVDGGTPRCLSENKGAALDGIGGRDNAGGRLLVSSTGLFNAVPDVLKASVQEDINEGKATTLLRLVDYNGQPDDDYVQVAVSASSGFDKVQTDDAGAAILEPRWDGTDPWYVPTQRVDVDPLTGQGGPWFLKKYLPGYVRGYELVVVASPNANGVSAFEYPLLGKSIPFSRGVLTATIVPGLEGAPYRLTNGVLAGATPPLEVYKSLRSVFAIQGPLCKASELPSPLNTLDVCANLLAAADLPNRSLCSGQDPATVPCGEISLTFGFTTVQAHAVPISSADAGTVRDLCPEFDQATECTRSAQP